MTEEQKAVASLRVKEDRKIAIFAIVVAVVLAGIVISIIPQTTQIERVAKNCGVEYAVEEEGRSIFLDTRGEAESYGDHPSSLKCVLDGLEAPPYIWDRMLSTYSSEPPQAVTWGHYTVAWMYRLDTGMRMSISHE